MGLHVGAGKRPLHHEVEGPRQQQAHVAPQPAQMIRAAAAPEHEINGVADHHYQGFPGETAMLIQFMAHTKRRTAHCNFLQVRQLLAVDQPAREHHGQGQHEVPHRHFQTASVQRRPQEQPQLHAHQPGRTHHTQQQLWCTPDPAQQFAHPCPVLGHQHEQGQAWQREQGAPAEDFLAVQWLEQRCIEVHHGEQAGRRD